MEGRQLRQVRQGDGLGLTNGEAARSLGTPAAFLLYFRFSAYATSAQNFGFRFNSYID